MSGHRCVVIITGLTNQYLSHLDNPVLEWGDCNVSGFSDPEETTDYMVPIEM